MASHGASPDFQSLRLSDLQRVVNSTALGTVVSISQVRERVGSAGMRVMQGGRVNLFAYAAWMRAVYVESQKPKNERFVAAQHMQQKRANARDIKLRRPESTQRRVDLEHDDAEWLKTYFAEIFYNPFTLDQLRTIEDIGNCLRYGIKKCKAAPRGDGKSSIMYYLSLKYALYRTTMFPLIVAATSSKSGKWLNNIKGRLRNPENKKLYADFPFECDIAKYVAPAPSRARAVTFEGYHVNIEWKPDYIVFPTLPGVDEFDWVPSEQVGPILMSVGVTSDDLQGCNMYDRRPDFVMLDDLDSRDSLAAYDGTVATKLEEIIDKNIAGLGGQNRKLGQSMICTVTSRDSIAFKYSDPLQKPAWTGERIPKIKNWPHAAELWERYIELRHKGQQTIEKGKPVDPFGRRAHELYLENFDEMNEGAILSNPNIFEKDEMPDGSQKQVSALQACYDYIADFGLDSFMTEHQQDPPSHIDHLSASITQHHIAHNCIGEFDRLQVADSTSLVVAGIDVRKIELHHVAFSADASRDGRIFDYNVHGHGTTETTTEQAEQLVLESLRRFAFYLEENPPVDEDGNEYKYDLTLIDKGWIGSWKEDGEFKTWASQPVETFCIEAGLRHFLPAHGMPRYTAPKPTDSCIVGDNWHMNKGRGAKRRCTEVNWNKAHWSQKAEERFLLEPDNAAAFELFQPSTGLWKNHQSFANHVINGIDDFYETLKNPSAKKRGGRWSKKDHWFDALAMALVAESVERWIRENVKPSARGGKSKPRRQFSTREEIGAR